jgi:hypothetical protein
VCIQLEQDLRTSAQFCKELIPVLVLSVWRLKRLMSGRQREEKKRKKMLQEERE